VLRHGEHVVGWLIFDRPAGADALAGWFVSVDCTRQSKVAQYLHNGPEYLEKPLRDLQGRRLVPTSTRTTGTAPDELTYLWENAGRRGRGVPRAASPRSVSSCGGEWLASSPGLCVADGVGSCPRLGGPVRDSRRVPVRRMSRAGSRSPDDLLILYTAGTTGRPKGVMSRQDDRLSRTSTRIPQVCAAAGNRVGVSSSSDSANPIPRHLAARRRLMHASGLLNAMWDAVDRRVGEHVDADELRPHRRARHDSGTSHQQPVHSRRLSSRSHSSRRSSNRRHVGDLSFTSGDSCPAG